MLVILSSCQKKDNSLEFEKNVMSEILTDLVDSIYFDIRLMPLSKNPYLEKGISDSLKNEKIKRHQIAIAKREKRIIEIKNDTSRIVIAVFDTIYTESLLKGPEIIKYNNIEYLFDFITKKIEYKIDLNKISKSDKFRFKYLSGFPNDKTIWKTKYPFYFGGVISFSRIQFDKNKKYGLLDAGITYADQDGEGFRIYIKKDINNKWIIEKIEGTWVT
tara:strand:- start:7095 stop:7745 length:651 start_codon:yes stop_codon:yes gene_type:complete